MDLIWRAIAEDVSRWTGEKPPWLMQLLFMLAEGDVIHLDGLSREMGGARERIEKALQAFAFAEMMDVLQPYGGPRRKRNYRKVIFLSPTFRWALHTLLFGGQREDRLEAALMEDLVGMILVRATDRSLISFLDGKAQIKPDFVLTTGDRPVLIEVGRGRKSPQQIVAYAENQKISYRYGLVISPTFRKPSWNRKNRILFLPFSWFLLV